MINRGSQIKSIKFSNEILVENISKKFGETVALNNCSIKIKQGEVHAIVGENGSGKSTLAKILSGVVMPDKGKLSIFGETPRSPMHARKIGVEMIFQEVLVAENLSVVDNIFSGSDGLFFRSISQNNAKKKSQEMLKYFTGIDINPDTLVKNLPLSVKQWIVISRSLISSPRMLILDESSASLDLNATNRLHKEIRKLRNKGCSILVVTHRIAELIRIADHATVLRDGSVVGDLSGNEITAKNIMQLISSKSNKSEKSQIKKSINLDSLKKENVLLAENILISKDSNKFNFKLKAGEIIGVTGLEGQGQANFINTIAGIKPPLSGDIYAGPFSQKNKIKNFSDADKFGVAYISGDRANEGIFPNLSIFENFSLVLYRTLFNQYGWIKMKPLKKSFNLEKKNLSIVMGRSSNRITSLSGGNQQKILIGRVLATKPKIIVLNDPTRGVDVGTKKELYSQFKNFVSAGGSVIYLSSEIEEFFDFADRVIVFRAGCPFATITPENFSEDIILTAMFGNLDPSNLTNKEN